MVTDKNYPSWRYKRGQFGKVESQCFNKAEDVPDGWFDSPEAAQEAGPKSSTKTRKKRAAKAKK